MQDPAELCETAEVSARLQVDAGRAVVLHDDARRIGARCYREVILDLRTRTPYTRSIPG